MAAPQARSAVDLFGDEEGGPPAAELTPPKAAFRVNEAFKRRFEAEAARKELARLEAAAAAESADSSSTSDSEGELATGAVGAKVLSTLGKIRKGCLEREGEVFEDEDFAAREAAEAAEAAATAGGAAPFAAAAPAAATAAAPLHFSEFYVKTLTREGAEAFAGDSDAEAAPPSNVEKLRAAKAAFLAAAAAEPGDALLAPAEPAPAPEKERADEEYREFLKSRSLKRLKSERDAEAMKAYLASCMSPEDEFLRDYILFEGWRGKMPKAVLERVGARGMGAGGEVADERIVLGGGRSAGGGARRRGSASSASSASSAGSGGSASSESAREAFEAAYNLQREQTPEARQIVGYARRVVDSVRAKEKKRQQRRAAREARKKAEKTEKLRALQRMQALRRGQVEEKLRLVREAAGGFFGDETAAAEALAAVLAESADFEPGAFDKVLQTALGEDYYEQRDKGFKPEDEGEGEEEEETPLTEAERERGDGNSLEKRGKREAPATAASPATAPPTAAPPTAAPLAAVVPLPENCSARQRKKWEREMRLRRALDAEAAPYAPAAEAEEQAVAEAEADAGSFAQCAAAAAERTAIAGSGADGEEALGESAKGGRGNRSKKERKRKRGSGDEAGSGSGGGSGDGSGGGSAGGSRSWARVERAPADDPSAGTQGTSAESDESEDVGDDGGEGGDSSVPDWQAYSDGLPAAANLPLLPADPRRVYFNERGENLWFQCDGCGCGVPAGKHRYECNVCEDYVLCQACFRAIKHKHVLKKRRVPEVCKPPAELLPAAVRKAAAAAAAAEAPPDALVGKLLDEYYSVDYEDILGGDLPTRFKYTKVQPRSYGLTATEVLELPDKELNQIVSVKKMRPYREDDGYKARLHLRARVLYNLRKRQRRLGKKS